MVKLVVEDKKPS